jgi:hypothetical protein
LLLAWGWDPKKLGWGSYKTKKQQDEIPKIGLICCFVLGAIAPNLHHGANFSDDGSDALISESTLEYTVRWKK